MEKRIRVLIAKLGLDGHTVGAMTVARALRDAGMEVIYTGLRQTPEMIVRTAIQEDVDVVGISILSGAHMEYLPKVVKLLKEMGADDKLVLAGGVIPPDDAARLKRLGISEIFTMGSRTSDIAEFIRNKVVRE